MKNYLIPALTSCSLALAFSQSAFAQDKPITTPVSVAVETSDRELDGLHGPVRRVRVETAKITVKEGTFTEGPRVLRETSTYDAKGRKIDSVAHPVEGSAVPGKEEYRYDDNGNIVEMTLRGDDGSILSKETYKYELDEMGNWKKMTSSVAIYENGKVVYEPIEVTYRTIAYYYGQVVDQLVSGKSNPEARLAKTSSEVTPKAPPATLEEKAPIASKVSTTSSSLAKSSENSIDNTNSLRTNDRAANTPADSPTANLNDGERQTKPASDVKLSTDSATNAIGEPAVTDKPAAAPPEKLSLSHAPEKEMRGAPDTVPEPEPPVARTESKLELRATTPDGSKNKPVEESRLAAPTAPSMAAAKSETSANLHPAVSHYEKGMAHLAANRLPEAVKAFSESVKFNPNNAQAYLKLGVAHEAQGQHKEAVAVLKMAIQIQREVVDAQGYYYLGRAYGALGKHSNALESFNQALYIMRAEAIDQTQEKSKNSPPLAHVHHGIGAMYYNMQRPKEAIKELKRAIELNPKLADAYYVLGLAYLEVGNRTSAEAQRNILQTLDSALAKKIDLAMSNFNPGHCKTVFGPCD